MAARAKFAVASLVLVATTWLLLDRGTVDSFLAQVSGAGEADSPALRGVRRLTSSGSEGGTAAVRQRNNMIASSAVGWQLVYGLIYYFVIVKNYPPLEGDPTEAARDTQSKNEVMAFVACENSFVINLTSLCCHAARAAHTYDKTGMMPYFAGLLLSAFCPLCTLCYMNACSDLNVKLGGEKRNFIMALICVWLCSCCVIAQDAQALDDCTGATVGLCGVEEGDEGSSAE